MTEPTTAEIEHAANLLRGTYLPGIVAALRALVREGVSGLGGRHGSNLPTVMLELDGLISIEPAGEGSECYAYAYPTPLARRVVCVMV